MINYQIIFLNPYVLTYIENSYWMMGGGNSLHLYMNMW